MEISLVRLPPELEQHVLRLRAEIIGLREELWYQWELNHHEHCGKRPLLHPGMCHFPLPSLLNPPNAV